MKFFVKQGATFPTCYGDPQSFLDSMAGAMDFQNLTETPLFYNGAIRNNGITGFGPPVKDGVYYGDAVWYDPRLGGRLMLDANFSFSVRALATDKGYRQFYGRSYGDIVPFVYKKTSATDYSPTNSMYYFPADVACVYNGWSRKTPYTTTGEGATTYFMVTRPWVMCDGYDYSKHPAEIQRSSGINKVPNLIARMIIGSGSVSSQFTDADERLPGVIKGGKGALGGSMHASLASINTIPDHIHNFQDKAANASVQTSAAAGGTGYSPSEPIQATSYATNTLGAYTNGLPWAFPSSVKPHQNLPPFYVVGFKMYVGYGE